MKVRAVGLAKSEGSGRTTRCGGSLLGALGPIQPSRGIDPPLGAGREWVAFAAGVSLSLPPSLSLSLSLPLSAPDCGGARGPVWLVTRPEGPGARCLSPASLTQSPVLGLVWLVCFIA